MELEDDDGIDELRDLQEGGGKKTKATVVCDLALGARRRAVPHRRG